MLLEEAQMSRGSYLYQLRKAPSKCLDAVYSEQIAAIREPILEHIRNTTLTKVLLGRLLQTSLTENSILLSQ